MRKSIIHRKTTETDIELELILNGTGQGEITTHIGFFDHMLAQLMRHGRFDIRLTAQGDYEIDDHHTVEDCAIALGQALAKALGDKRGICRYGEAHIPMDETLVRAVVDLSGRPALAFNVSFPVEKIGSFDTQLVREFFQAFANSAGMNIHLDLLRGENAHHISEACFKAFARALRQATAIDTQHAEDIPSTKGQLREQE